MSLLGRLEVVRQLVDAGIIRDGEGVTTALRAMEPTRPVRTPEETKPPARAHLKGCALDTDHADGCVVSLWFTDAEPFMFKASAPPALSPRQALGEAVACVERALSLVSGEVHRAPTSEPHAFNVRGMLKDVHAELGRAYEAAK